jgi:hypothetical protein
MESKKPVGMAALSKAERSIVARRAAKTRRQNAILRSRSEAAYKAAETRHQNRIKQVEEGSMGKKMVGLACVSPERRRSAGLKSWVTRRRALLKRLTFDG